MAAGWVLHPACLQELQTWAQPRRPSRHLWLPTAGMQRLITTQETEATLNQAHLPAGTITLLIIRHDERTGRYRSQSGILQHYTRMNQLPAVS